MAISPYAHPGSLRAATAEARRLAMLDSALDAIITIDASGRILEFNAAAEQVFGHARADVEGRLLSDVIIPPHLREAHERGFARHLATGEARTLGRRMALAAVRSDGTEFPVELTITRAEVDGEVLFTGYLRDLTEMSEARESLERATAALEASERNLRTIVASAPMVLSALDADGVFTLCEGRGLAALGLLPGELVGQSVFDAFAEYPVVAELARRALDGQELTATATLAGREFEITHSPIPGPVREGEAVLISVATDVTERRRSEAQLAHDASHDRLTGLVNRASLEERLVAAVAAAGGDTGAIALLNLDVDDFKTINDSLGHATGDDLLCALARRLEARVDGQYLLARHGGDEFMLVLDGLPGDGRAVAEAIASEMLRCLDRPFALDSGELLVGASIGISLFPGDAAGAADLLKHADTAMYQAKRAGRGGYAVYRAEDDGALRRLELTNRLRSAVQRGELELHYQPVYDLQAARAVAAEALVRWNDPERGMVSPGEFIPLAEETGMIDAIGEWVQETACRQLREWQDRRLELELAINVSPRELARPGFARRLGERLAAHGVRPGSLTLEIIESALVDTEAVSPVLDALSALGVRVAIDDFGAGFSSLTRLRELTVHTLKLDRSFLHNVPEDRRATAFITAMLALAEQLGLDVVAEGIETPSQLGFLLSEGCPRGQGFHLGRPMPAPELIALLEAQASGRSGATS
jgi:diguanylate cyclase (GGDEF)-like protein/PAS domain S-box-containing protein